MRFSCGCSLAEDGTRLESCPKPRSPWCTVQDGARGVEETERVNHPPHYGGADNPYEVIKVIEVWGLNYHLGNAVKYIARADKKGNPIEDLRKAVWFVNRELSRRHGSHV